MALSGSFTGSTNNTHIEPTIVWSATQDITGNYSDVTATLYYSRTNAGYTTYGPWSGGITINGVRTAGSNRITITQNSNTMAFTATTRVYHNTDGTKAIHISSDGGIPTSSLSSTSCSSDVTLDQIPRQATLTYASDFHDAMNANIVYSNPAGDAVTSLAACISLTGDKDDVPYRTISKTLTNYTFRLTEAEKTTLYKATLSNSTSRTVIFRIRTDIGGDSYYSSLTKTFRVTDCDPTLEPTVIDTKSSSTALTGNPSTIIKNYNKVKVTFNATAKKEASISSAEVTCGGMMWYSDTDITSWILNNVDSGTFVCKVTDNRGLSASKTVVADMIDYTPLTCNSSYTTELIAGSNLNITLNINGSYFKGSFGKVENSLSIKYRYKINNGAYPDTWTTVSATPTISNGKYSVQETITGLDYQNTYTIQVKAADAIYNDTAEPAKQSEQVVKINPVFDWSENDFNFNVPVHSKGGFTYNVPIVYTGDVDTILTSGKYFIETAVTNKPGSLNGWLEVLTSDTEGLYVYQKYITSTGEKYERWRQQGNWGAWFSSGTRTSTQIIDMSGVSVTATFCRNGNVTVLYLNGTATSNATKEASLMYLTIPEGFRPNSALITARNTTDALYIRGSYSVINSGSMAIHNQANILIHWDFSNIYENYTVGASMTWIN